MTNSRWEAELRTRRRGWRSQRRKSQGQGTLTTGTWWPSRIKELHKKRGRSPSRGYMESLSCEKLTRYCQRRRMKRRIFRHRIHLMVGWVRKEEMLLWEVREMRVHSLPLATSATTPSEYLTKPSPNCDKWWTSQAWRVTPKAQPDKRKPKKRYSTMPFFFKTLAS